MPRKRKYKNRLSDRIRLSSQLAMFRSAKVIINLFVRQTVPTNRIRDRGNTARGSIEASTRLALSSVFLNPHTSRSFELSGVRVFC
jgi:hypothetical protein